jgi:hypothetical protein
MTDWHREAVTSSMVRTLETLERQGVLTGFYLAGGTALALHLGHRRSVDLDFFTPERFEDGALLQRLDSFSLTARDRQTLHGEISGTKVSFLAYEYPVLFPQTSFLGVSVADPRDIACMKISAITSRGARRDFIDLYAATRLYGMPELLRLFHQKYARVNYSRLHVLKSLTYFEDAEKDPMPEMLAPIPWTEVKSFFLREAPPLLLHRP